MRKVTASIDDAKNMVESLYGKQVSVRYNKGRNKIFHYKGVISEKHANVFVITVYNELFDRLSCSYADLLCGEVKLKELTEKLS